MIELLVIWTAKSSRADRFACRSDSICWGAPPGAPYPLRYSLNDKAGNHIDLRLCDNFLDKLGTAVVHP